MLNGWPLDENFVDYTTDEPEAGIINEKKADASFEVPEITKEVVAEENEKGGEKNLSAGWHAIDFLLWGQDFNAAGPGDRPYTDFVDGGTAKNQGRRPRTSRPPRSSWSSSSPRSSPSGTSRRPTPTARRWPPAIPTPCSRTLLLQRHDEPGARHEGG
jgi:hypothetical protein